MTPNKEGHDRVVPGTKGASETSPSSPKPMDCHVRADSMTVQIRNDKEYAAAMAEIKRLMDLDPPLGTPDGLRLSILASLAEAYECGTATLLEKLDAALKKLPEDEANRLGGAIARFLMEL